MKKQSFLGSRFCALALLGLMAILFSTCDTLKDPAKLTLLLTADDASLLGSGPKQEGVSINALQSLALTISEVIFLRGEGDDTSPVSIFNGAIDLDLVNLLGISEVFATPDVPQGTYSGIVLVISNPQLIFAAQPSVVITDVLLPDNGELLVPVDFIVDPGGEGILVLDLGSISLLDLGDDTFSFTPTLEVRLEEETVEAQAIGRLTQLDTVTDLFDLHSDDANLVVSYANALIFVPDDFDSPSGTEQNLSNGARTFVFGTLIQTGGLDASIVIILEQPQLDDDVFLDLDSLEPSFGPATGGNPVQLNGQFPVLGPISSIVAANAAYAVYFGHQRAAFDLGITDFITATTMNVIAPPSLSLKSDSRTVPVRAFALDAFGEIIDETTPEPYSYDSDDGQVTIGHIPPDNPEARHVLQVSPAALSAHLAHGDAIVEIRAIDSGDVLLTNHESVLGGTDGGEGEGEGEGPTPPPPGEGEGSKVIAN